MSPHHARTAAWTSTATRRWVSRCDVCGQWRLVADYYECYAPFGTGGGWWFSCGGCLLDVVDDLRAAVTQAAAGVVEADQCWHQQSWDAGEYDGDFHPGECFGLAICDDPCRLCLLTRVVEPDHDPDWLDEDDAALDLARQMVGWDALPSPCTEHGMESCPCEEGATYPPHDAASERLGECRACHHGAPCFLDGQGHKAAPEQVHVVGTHPTCSACIRYRNHLDISFEEAQRIALEGLHERADPTHSCLACSWGR